MNRFLVMALVVLAGCDRRPASTPSTQSTESTPSSAADTSARASVLAVEWPSPERFQVVGQPGLGGKVYVYGGVYKVQLQGFPAGTRWKVAGKTGHFERVALEILDVADLTAALLDLPVAGLSDARLGGGATLVLVPPEGGRVEVSLPPAPVSVMGIHDLFAQVEKGPVLFPGEAAGGTPIGTLLLTHRFAIDFQVFGRAAERLRDIDGVAVRRVLPVRRTKRCHGVRGMDEKVLPDLTLRLRETEIVVFDRRTGAVLHRRVFPPEEACPRFDVRSADMDSFLPHAAIEEWLRSLVRP